MLRKFSSTILSRSMSSPPKITKLNPYIGTHDSTFHCDDVTACYMLKTMQRFRDHDIVRTRDPELLAGAEIIVDVGGVLDVERLRLDHHQRTFNQTIKDYHPKMKTTNPDKPPRLSSAGLVYAVFGKEFISQLLELGSYEKLDENKKMMIDCLYVKVYTGIIEEIDAIDNGVDVASGDNLVYNYHINSGISSRVGRLNPYGEDVTPELRLDQFRKAMEVVGSEMADGIKYLADHWWPNRQKLREFVTKRKEFDTSGQIVYIDKDQLSGWRSALYELEEELDLIGELKFIVFNDQACESSWRVTTVSVDPKSFASRVPLKAEWCGLRDEELQKISGVSDATFVHMSGFTGGAKSKDGVLSLIHKTLGLS